MGIDRRLAAWVCLQSLVRGRENKGMLTRTISLLAASAAMLASHQASSQAPGTVTVDVAQCFELESDAARRDCFAAEVDAVLEKRESEPQPAVQPPAAEPPASEPRRAQSDQPAQPEQQEFFGTITAVQERMPNAYVITLDNGQVWQQVQPEMYLLRPGIEVRIYPTRWGESYRLSAKGAGRYIQVRRVQ